MALAVAEFQQVIDELSTRVGTGVDKLLSRLDRLSTDEAFGFVGDAYPAFLEPFLKAAGEVAAQWYAEQPAVEVPPGAAAFVPVAAPLPPSQDLGRSARWALTTPSPDLSLKANADRRVFNQTRDTVTTNARREGVRWVREAKPNACGFCRLMAIWSTEGKTFGDQFIADKRDQYGNLTGEKTVVIGRGRKRRPSGRKPGEEYHDHCRCTAIPLRDGSSYTAPDYVYEWRSDYDRIILGDGTQPGVSPNDTKKVAFYLDKGRVRDDRPQSDSVYAPKAKPTGDVSTPEPVQQPKPTKSKATTAEQLLPGLEQSLADLRAQGLPEDSPQIKWHLAQIARLRADLAVAN